MTLQKISITVSSKRYDLPAKLQYSEADLSARRSLGGSFTGPKSDYLDLLGPSLREVFASVENMNYQLTDLKSDGSFVLVSTASI